MYPLTAPKVITDAILEPVSVAEVKLNSRIDVDDDDNLIAIHIAAARRYLEWRTARTFHQQTLEWILGRWPGGSSIKLPRATPLISIESAKYKDSDGVETTWDSAEYIADTDSMPGRLVLGYNQSWPSFTPYPVSAIRIRYLAGIETASPAAATPEEVRYPMLLLCGAMYENRESIVVPDSGSIQELAISYGVEAYISRLRVEYAF